MIMGDMGFKGGPNQEGIIIEQRRLLWHITIH